MEEALREPELELPCKIGISGELDLPLPVTLARTGEVELPFTLSRAGKLHTPFLIVAPSSAPPTPTANEHKLKIRLLCCL
ncbi:Os03g0750833 [Oryza sativa Japonica Group]|jgi:hypothetical protein|uniref:Os03g0750833 protein n=1 Tax=Oryza sativa subsp. japonica TaxID=39947 RepID=A0A0P0W3Q7_ORYSJ|nr:Os03g0750833 [Oryza sativa Japonica Group]